MIFNPTALSRLPTLEFEDGLIEAYLKPEGSDTGWVFLVNPSELRYDGHEAQYQENPTYLSNAPEISFSNVTAKKLIVQGLFFDTWCERKDQTEYLESLDKLKEVSPSEGIFEPPTLSFIFGENRFEPCKLVKAPRTVRKFLGKSGKPAGVAIEFEFIKIPPTVFSDTEIIKPPDALTERQLEEGIEAAQAYLKENTERYDSIITQIIDSEEYELVSADDGTISMIVESQSIGVVGTWDGSEFTTDNESLKLRDETTEETSDTN